jgi:hypothetical protein
MIVDVASMGMDVGLMVLVTVLVGRLVGVEDGVI